MFEKIRVFGSLGAAVATVTLFYYAFNKDGGIHHRGLPKVTFNLIKLTLQFNTYNFYFLF